MPHSVGDVILTTIDAGAVVHPGGEHGAGGAPELVPRVVGEGFAGAVLHEGFEALNERLLVGGGEVRVYDVAVVNLVFEQVDGVLEGVVILALAFLHAHDDIAIHLDEAAVTVVGEAGVAGGLFQGDDSLVVEAEVKNGIHHTGHRVAGAGAHGHEEGHAGGGAELGAHDLLHVFHAGFHLRLEGGGIGFFVGVIVSADLGRDGEAGGNGQVDAGHLGQVGALAPEKGLHRAVAIGFTGAPGINVFDVFAGGLTGGFFRGGGGFRGGFRRLGGG